MDLSSVSLLVDPGFVFAGGAEVGVFLEGGFVFCDFEGAFAGRAGRGNGGGRGGG